MKGTQETQVKTKNNTKAILHFIAIILTVITMISIAIGLFAWSRYTATQSGNATAQVAKWNFNLSLQSGGTPVTAGSSLNLADTLDQEATHVADGKIAPGTSGTFDIVIDTSGTEVSMVYDVTITMENCPRNITFSKKGPGENNFTVISAAKTGDVAERARTISFSKYLRAKDENQQNENGVKTETIKWEWPYELTGNDPATNQPYTETQKTEYDSRDNADQGRTVTLNITAVGAEVMNTPLSVATITDKNGNPLHDGDTLEVYAQGTNKINVPTGANEANRAESVTFTSSDTTVATVGTDGTITGVAAGNATITITGQETGKTTSINISVKPAITVTVNGTPTTLTSDNTGSYYGSIVTNYTVDGQQYQLFFIDFEGKYGNKGDIYLKKKDTITQTEGLPTTTTKTINDTTLKIKEMNKLWAAAENQAIDTDAERAVAWLCDTTVWSAYAAGDTKARYAIGSPSIEMYVASYNEAVEAYNKANGKSIGRLTYSLPNSNGYRCSGIRETFIGKNNVYFMPKSMWFASPSYNNGIRVVCADSNYYDLRDNIYYNRTIGVSPLVCLESDFSLQLK